MEKEIVSLTRINKSHIPYLITICIFILSEYCPLFQVLDSLHLKHLLVIMIIGLYYFRNHMLNPSTEMKFCLCTASVLYGITLICQLHQRKLMLYSIEEIYYLIIPILFVDIVYKANRGDNMDDVMSAILLSGLFSFFTTCADKGTLSIENFRAMFDINKLFIESESPMIESGLSSFFVLLYIYFLYRNKYKRAVLSAFGVFLGFKRVATLYMLILTLVFRFIPKHRKVPKLIIRIAMVSFIVLPFVAELMCTDEFAMWFYQQFEIEFNKFTMTRFYIINLVIDADLPQMGLGTTTYFLESRGHDGQLNMHNDILRIYMECGFWGSVALSVNNFKMVAKHWYSFLTMLFLMLQMFVTHCLGSGNLSIWIIAYMIIFYFNRTDSKSLDIK